MIQIFIALTIILLLLVAATFVFTKDMKVTRQYILIELLSILLGIGCYYAATRLTEFVFNYWASIGIMFGLALLAWNFTNITKKQKFSIVEVIVLVLLPLAFYPLYGLDLALNLLLGIYPVIIAYTLSLTISLSRKLKKS
jgi:hypothetical protein